MNFDISALSEDFKSGLAELKKDYNFSINGKTAVFTEFGHTAGIVRTGDGFLISFAKKCEFYREFMKLLHGEVCVKEERQFENLSVMLDCSRNAVMKVSTVKALIRKLAVMGYNELELYTEDTYEITDEPFFGYMRGRYTSDEIKEIDVYASLFGIELVPCIQALAHLNGITRWNRFKSLIDCNDILLVDDERTYEFIDKMFFSVSENFTSRKLHIGMDEAHMVGLGKYLDEHGFENRFEIMQRHLTRVLKIAEKYSFACTMWSDMFFRLVNHGKYEPTDSDIPDSLNVPQNVTLEYWDYYRNSESEYEKMIVAHKELTDKISFACGAWRWNTFTPSNKMSINRNILALSACKKHGIKDVKVTLWGDDGGECPTFAMLPTLVASAEFAYGYENYEKAFERITGVEATDFYLLEMADNPSGEDGAFYGGNFTKIFLYNDLLCGIYDYCAKPEYKNVYLSVYEKCSAATKRNRKYVYLFDTAAALAHLIAEKYDFGIRLRKAYKKGDMQELKVLSDKISELVVMLNKLYRALKKQWYAENKPFGFEVQDIRLGGLRQRMLHCHEVVNSYVKGKLDRISELEIEILQDENYCDKPEFRCDDKWQKIVSVNRI